MAARSLMSDTVRHEQCREQENGVQHKPLSRGRELAAQNRTASTRDEWQDSADALSVERALDKLYRCVTLSVARCLRVNKAETIGDAIGCGRSRVYELAQDASALISQLAALLELDPNPDAPEMLIGALAMLDVALSAQRRSRGQQSITLGYEVDQ